MKKKITTLGIVALLVLGAGNAVYANSGSDDGWNFEDMLPFMTQMHPEMNEQEMEQMYQNCHGSNDQAPVTNEL